MGILEFFPLLNSCPQEEINVSCHSCSQEERKGFDRKCTICVLWRCNERLYCMYLLVNPWGVSVPHNTQSAHCSTFSESFQHKEFQEICQWTSEVLSIYKYCKSIPISSLVYILISNYWLVLVKMHTKCA